MKLAFNPIGNPFDFVSKSQSDSKSSFSYLKTESNEIVTIPKNQQMLFKGILMNYGLLKNLGQIIPVKDDTSKTDTWNPIPTNQTVIIENNRVMLFKKIFKNYGILRNFGTVEAI